MSTRAATDKRYWKSVQRLHDSPAVEEFPEDASLPPEGLARRRMLSLMGASIALAGLSSCRRPEERIVPFVEAPEDYVPGVSKRYASTMTIGVDACGILVESHEGRPTKIEGNPLHGASLGAANAWTQAALLGLYDPDRSTSVLRRSSESEERVPATWDDFLDLWRPAALSFEESGGRGLALLLPAYASPSVSLQVKRFEERFPKALRSVYEPLGDENIYRGTEHAFGRALRPIYHLRRARTILSLDCDFLSTESGALRHARDFAATRDPGNGEMSRLYAVESSLTTTGAAADHRLARHGRELPIFLLRLVEALETLGVPVGLGEIARSPADAVRPEWNVEVLAEELAESERQSLLLVGRRQPAVVHAVAHRINAALGAVGATVTYHEPVDTEWGDMRSLSTLARAMGGGEIETLLILGGNPVYSAPADLEFGKAMAEVPRTVHLSLYVDETSRLADWHLPAAHFLEAWGDARTLDGTASIAQPLIRPLYRGRSLLETLGLLVSDDHRDGFSLVRDAWLPGLLGEENVESKWNRVVHDGELAGSAIAASAVSVRPMPRAGNWPHEQAAIETQSIALEIAPSSAVYDGRFANNAWLQELPDPITKLTWDNALLLSPATARELDLTTSDVVALTSQGRSLRAPVLVSPGQAYRTATLAMGYGRSAAGRVGEGVGTNANALRTSDQPFLLSGVSIRRTGERYELAVTQDHWSMEGRDLIRESTPEKQPNGDPHAETPLPLWEAPAFEGEHQWGMVIDLNRCTGCNACITACQAENNVPVVGKDQVRRGREMQWLRVDRYFSDEPDTPRVSFQPVPCMHCENAPCEQVCPVGATVHDSDGLNAMVYNRCIGTRYCSNNCPYKVRRFNFFNYTKDLPEVLAMGMNPDVTVRSRGVMEKCTYCVQRIHEAKIEAKREARGVADGEVRPACQQTCAAEAITFGNIADPESRVSKLKQSPRNYVLLGELNHSPRTSYLAKIRNPGRRTIRR